MQRPTKARAPIEPTCCVNALGITSTPMASRPCACGVRPRASPRWPELPVTKTVTPLNLSRCLSAVSGPETGIDSVELAQQRRPDQRGRTQFGAVAVSEQVGVLVHHGFIDRIGCWSQHA